MHTYGGTQVVHRPLCTPMEEHRWFIGPCAHLWRNTGGSYAPLHTYGGTQVVHRPLCTPMEEHRWFIGPCAHLWRNTGGSYAPVHTYGGTQVVHRPLCTPMEEHRYCGRAIICFPNYYHALLFLCHWNSSGRYAQGDTDSNSIRKVSIRRPLDSLTN